jgi:hypothetical protein
MSSQELTEWMVYFKIKSEEMQNKVHHNETLERLKTRKRGKKIHG